ncbi:Replicase polyprotein 1ab [Actinoplanes sp. TRM 88003]|uniref:Replicase polyprotein 1ab n=1 Tax=Paractinoplanes aksuensis TaxID=2939490 RepID=A0ABT1DP02_9ACTN|nr:Replicase polyprotein 1ab [Actinoplanes aksuensis]MCO8271481.1 Replicase polyprotein 1ab [Actinoplanes aksuensis]
MAAGQIIDEDAELALQHAIAARRLASRIAVVREAVGLAAYAAGDWTTAIAELRTYHRMTGRQTHLAELADCERALGRPERAIDLYRGADLEKMDKSGAIELLIVAAGARTDLGQHDAAVAMLQVRELNADEDAEWAARLRYAYADALLAADRREEAREWFTRAAAADDEGLTDAAERLLELDGVTLADEDTEPSGGDERTGTTPDEEEGEFDGDDERAALDDDDEDDEYDDEDDLDDEPAARSDVTDEDEDDEVVAAADTDVNTDPVAVEDVAEELEADAEELADAKKADADKADADKADAKKADADEADAKKGETQE